MNNLAWTTYELTPKKELGQFLLNGLGLGYLRKKQDIVIKYSGNNLWLTDKSLLLADDDNVYKLYLETQIGECDIYSY
jgi:hypothetical protein